MYVMAPKQFGFQLTSNFLPERLGHTEIATITLVIKKTNKTKKDRRRCPLCLVSDVYAMLESIIS